MFAIVGLDDAHHVPLGVDAGVHFVHDDRIGDAEIVGGTLVQFVKVADPDAAVAEGLLTVNKGEGECHVG